jgi:hypothetical protein
VVQIRTDVVISKIKHCIIRTDFKPSILYTADIQIVLCITPISSNNCFNSSWHTFYKILACFCCNLIPFHLHPILQLMHPLRWCWILLQSPFKMYHVIVFKLLENLLGGMFGVIILLEYSFFLWYLQLLKAFYCYTWTLVHLWLLDYAMWLYYMDWIVGTHSGTLCVLGAPSHLDPLMEG